MSSSSLALSEAANLFLISIWYCFLTSRSFSFLRLNLSTSNFCAACIFTANLSLTFATNRQGSVSQSDPLTNHISSIFKCHLLSINIWSIWLWVFPSGEVQVYLWMFWWEKIMLLTTRTFWCGKVYYSNTIIIISWCRLLFPIVGFTIFSLPNFTLKYPNRFFVWYLGKW